MGCGVSGRSSSLGLLRTIITSMVNATSVMNGVIRVLTE